MARNIPKLLLSHHDHHQLLHKISSILPPWLTIPVAATFLGILSVLSIVMFLCGGSSHGEKKGSSIKSKIRRGELKTERLGDQNSQRVSLSRLQSSMSSKALLLKSKMMMMQISWKKVQDEGENLHEYNCYEDDDGDDDQDAIWKKTIIKGEKCRPLNFSGKILYDSYGNRLPDSPTRHPPN